MSMTVLLFITWGSGWIQAAEKVPYRRLKAWQTAKTAEERAYVTETYTLFRIIEPKYVKEQLQRNVDYAAFKHRVEKEWKPSHPERWNEVAQILDFCRQERLGTAIDDVEPDSRWELFLRYGKPRYNTLFTILCSGGNDECTSWNFTFDPRKEGEPPPTASCVLRPGMSYPTEILDTEEQSFPAARPIYPSVTYSRFYGDLANGEVDLWFSIWYSGNQFTRATVDHAELTTRIELWDSGKNTLIDEHETTYSFDAVRGVLRAMRGDARAKVRVMRYVHFRVKPGTYRARVHVIGADKYNEGGGWYEDPIVVPEESDMSDLLVLAQNLVQGTAVARCIQRGNELYLCNNPEGRIPKTGSLDLYTEFRLPARSQVIDQLVSKVTLRPLREITDPNPKPGDALVGPGLVQHFDGQPFLGGRSRQDWERAVKEFFEDVDDREFKLMEQTIDVDDPEEVQSLNLSTELREMATGKRIPAGKYLLTVRIEGCGFGCSPAVSRTIYVVP
jgi:hypothetical protein